jgi:hypothetical protein
MMGETYAVVAIDIGTAMSGYAFSFYDDEEIIHCKFEGNSMLLVQIFSLVFSNIHY